LYNPSEVGGTIARVSFHKRITRLVKAKKILNQEIKTTIKRFLQTNNFISVQQYSIQYNLLWPNRTLRYLDGFYLVPLVPGWAGVDSMLGTVVKLRFGGKVGKCPNRAIISAKQKGTFSKQKGIFCPSRQ